MGGGEGRGGAASPAQNRAYLRERNELRCVLLSARRNFLFPTSFLFVPLTHTAPPTDDTVNHRVADAGDAERSAVANAVGPRRAGQARVV